MKTRLLLTLCYIIIALFLDISKTNAQDYFPENGIKDKQAEVYAFTNATIHVDYKTTIENATLVVAKGNVLGVNITVPKNAIVYNVNGAHIYPSFTEIFSDYGLPEISKSKKEGFSPQYESNKKGAYGWNQAIKTEQEAYMEFTVQDEKAKTYRESGIGNVISHFKDGIARGSGFLAMTGNESSNKMLVENEAAAFYSFDKGSSTQAYPGSLMGVIALLRQTYLDGKWYDINKNNLEKNISLEKWTELQSLPTIFEANQVLNILRADKIGDEFGKQYIIKGGGDEYQKIEGIKATKAHVIIPLNFPKTFDVEDPYDAQNVSLTEMKHWEMAPANAKYLFDNNIDFAFTTTGLEKISDVITQLQKTVEYGIPKEIALKAMVYNPLQFLQLYSKAGSLEKDKLANFFLTTEDLFEKKTKIIEHWIHGKQYIINKWDYTDIRGKYELTIKDKKYNLEIDGDKTEPKIKIAYADSIKSDVPFSRKNNIINLQIALEKDSASKITRLSGVMENNQWGGKGQLPNGEWTKWEMQYKGIIEKKKEEKKENEKPELGKIIYPFTAYGKETITLPENVILKNATLWTNENDGIITNADLWIENGKIKSVGKNLVAANVATIDATGKHITPGLIDEHSHIAISRGVNEGTKSSSAEVRIGDVINSEDLNIYRQLAGGVTSSQLLHGSANAIGGQSALIKLRWGYLPEQMKITGADGFIKFALGENVKQANWGDFNTIRYPQTRMGVEQIYVDYFTRAKEYSAKLSAYENTKNKNGLLPIRKDLELDAVAEILNSKRFITCHSYVQSEINMLMHVADSFGFKVNTFTHILEGYKLADKMKTHGVNASTFADWWAYKYEVIDAIPQNAQILESVGVNTAINSDDAEMGRRLNQEAAKSIKYAGMNEEEALKLITLNPAKMLHLDNRLGSLKTGKDADIVVWNTNPLSIYAKPEMTFVEGFRFYDAAQDKAMRKQIADERNRLIQKMIAAKKGGAPTQKPVKKEQKIWHCEDIDDHYH